MISFPTPTWLFDLKSGYAANPTVQNIVQAIQSGQVALKGFIFCNDLLFYKGRLYLGQFNGDLKAKVLQQVRDGPLGSHSGYLKTFHIFKKDFYWPGMGKDLKQYIRECDVC